MHTYIPNKSASVKSVTTHLAITLFTTLIVGCSSIPLITPDMAMQSPRKVKLEGAQGSLSNAQSKAILARLKKNGADTNIFDRHLALESEIVGSPLIIGNS